MRRTRANRLAGSVWLLTAALVLMELSHARAQAHYALGNLLYYPVKNVMVVGELQWGRRENFSDGFQSDGLKLQFSFKYNFSFTLGGQ